MAMLVSLDEFIGMEECPFCGGEAFLRNNWTRFNVTCKKDDCFGNNNVWFESKEEAIEAWNTRHERTCEFITEGYGWRECSNCGCSLDYDSVESPTNNYCPNCGSKIMNNQHEKRNCKNNDLN